MSLSTTEHAIYLREWARRDPARTLWLAAKHRARRLKIIFDIVPDDVVIPPACPILGIPLFMAASERKGGRHNSPSLDRIVPEKGYVRGNIRVISWRANHLKSSATPEELCALADFFRSGR
jgi:hypothetical protein